jgi:hypothetical protein
LKKKPNQRGVSDATLIMFIVVLSVAVLAVPKLLLSNDDSGKPPEVRQLRRIYAAQTKYRTKISVKEIYGSFQELIDTKTLESDFPFFEVSRNYEETRFCVAVGNYAVNADGKIYEGGTCSMGEVAGQKLKEIK